MPKTTMGPDVARIATRLATAVERGRGKVIRSSAMKAKAIQAAEIKRVVGGDMKMSGVGRSGGKVGVRFDARGGSEPSVLLRATGPLHLVERPTQSRLITSRYGRGSRRSRAGRAGGGGAGTQGPVIGSRLGGGRRAVMNIPGIGYRRYVRHPGTSGQQPWVKGRKRAEPVIASTMRKETRSIISAARR